MSSVAGVNVATAVASAYPSNETAAAKASSKEKETTTKKDTAASEGAVYEKSTSEDKAPYKINKMSSEERSALVQQLKQDEENRRSQLLDIVNQSITGQAKRFAQANDDLWQFLAKGDFTVDAATKAQAQKDIAEDGYYGVKQTAERIFNFASALAGDDVDKMKEMQKAFEKGFKQATKSWGQELPSISGQTRDKVNEMFEEYYDSKKTITEE